jgi:hypothetical protein
MVNSRPGILKQFWQNSRNVLIGGEQAPVSQAGPTNPQSLYYYDPVTNLPARNGNVLSERPAQLHSYDNANLVDTSATNAYVKEMDRQRQIDRQYVSPIAEERTAAMNTPSYWQTAGENIGMTTVEDSTPPAIVQLPPATKVTGVKFH